MHKLFVWGKSFAKSDIDEAVAARDIELLANLVLTDELAADVREHLAQTLFELLNGTKKFPRGKPKNKRLAYEREEVAKKVWETKKREGWEKISSAIECVAKEIRRSPRDVWKCWSGFNFVAYEIRREEAAYDYMLDAANTAEWETAVASLTEAHGNREFSDEEIRDQIEADRAARGSFDEY